MTSCFKAKSRRSNRNWFQVGTPARALSPAPAKRTQSPAMQLWTRSAGTTTGGNADGCAVPAVLGAEGDGVEAGWRRISRANSATRVLNFPGAFFAAGFFAAGFFAAGFAAFFLVAIALSLLSTV